MYINSKFKFSNTTSSIIAMVVDFLCSNKYFYKLFFWFLIPFLYEASEFSRPSSIEK